MPTKAIVIQNDLRAWLDAEPGRTAAALASLLGLPRRTVENWLQGRPCTEIVAREVVLPRLKGKPGRWR